MKFFGEPESKYLFDSIIPEYARLLIRKYHPWLNREVLLRTIVQIESSNATNVVPRFEKAYSIGGKYWRAPHIKKLFRLYGDFAACSVGPTQIMYPTAWELGCRLSPADLHMDWEACIQYTVKLLNKRILRKRYKGEWVRNARSVEEIADGYNSGNPRDLIIPADYISKFVRAYLKMEGMDAFS